MYAHISIGENLGEHTGCLLDSITGTTEVVLLPDETTAVKFLQDFLHLDEPGEFGVYRSLVTKPDFLP